jgi:hypothetical protein
VDWRTGLSGVPPGSVRCTRTVQVSTSHSRENEGTLRDNSPDCPVSQRSNDYLRQRSTLTTGTVQHNTAQKSEQRSQRGTGLSGVTPDCLVPQEDKASNGRPAPNPNSWVTWQHRTRNSASPVVHWSVRCAHRQQPPQRLWKWLGAINTP